MKDNTLLYVGGGLALLYLFMRSTPTAIAAQQNALNQAAALQSQAINANATQANINTGAQLLTNLANDFSS